MLTVFSPKQIYSQVKIKEIRFRGGKYYLSLSCFYMRMNKESSNLAKEKKRKERNLDTTFNNIA